MFDPPGTDLPPGTKLEVLLLFDCDAKPFSAELRLGESCAAFRHGEPGTDARCESMVLTTPAAGKDGNAGLPRLSIATDSPLALWMVHATPFEALSPPATYSLLAGAFRKWGETGLAMALWERYAAVYPTGPRHVEGLLAQVDLLRAAGASAEAQARFLEATAALEGLRPATDADLTEIGYDLNRSYGDVLATHRLRSPAWDGGGEESGSEQPPAWLAVGPSQPHPRYRRKILDALEAFLPEAKADSPVATSRAARALAERRRVLAQHGLVCVLSAVGDRTGPRRAKLAANQSRLDEISAALPADDLARAFRLLHRLAGEPPVAEGDEGILARAALWNEAEQAGLRGDIAACSLAFRTFCEKWPTDAASPYAELSRAQWLHYSGRSRQARTTYERARDAGPSAVSWHAELGLAEADFADGEYAQAHRRYGKLEDRAVAESATEWLRFRQAQCCEFRGMHEKATGQYRELEKSSDMQMALAAQFAARRTQAGADGSRPGRHRKAATRYVGEDRVTRGDWWMQYGSEGFTLCALHCPRDVSAARLPGWSVQGRCGDARESLRHWATGAGDSHDSFLHDPVANRRRAANWDDRGEVYARGTGPDLWLDLVVPDGEHMLALYFANDVNYYEPDRVYTVSVYGRDGTYQTGTEVRHFVNGIYKRFAVSGPADLSVRIERGLSINVLLSGVFLSPLQAPALPPRLRRQHKPWESARGQGSPADERELFDEALAVFRKRIPEGELREALWSLAEAEAKAGRFAPSLWAAEARLALAGTDGDASATLWRELTDLYLVRWQLMSPHLMEILPARPFAELAFSRYLGAALPELEGGAARDLCRRISREHAGRESFLAAMAYSELARVHGTDAWEDEDRLRAVVLSDDVPTTIARIEGQRRNGTQRLPPALELALLGCYLRSNEPDLAMAVKDRMATTHPDDDATANAIYLMWDHFHSSGQADRAVACQQEITAKHPQSKWRTVINQRLAPKQAVSAQRDSRRTPASAN